jgi:hypothetical protein
MFAGCDQIWIFLAKYIPTLQEATVSIYMNALI